MLLREYLRRTTETPRHFANRAGLKEGAVRAIMAGGGCRVDTAIKIIEASGGLVGLEDLVPAGKPEEVAA
jgi:hypothetical protein